MNCIVTKKQSAPITTIAGQHATAVHELFEQRAVQYSQRVAVSNLDDSISYHELNTQSNLLAHYLIQQGINPGDRVAICMSRSIAMIKAVIAILKAGATYVPLDPDYPPKRLSYIALDSAPKLVLVDKETKGVLPDLKCAVLQLDSGEVYRTLDMQKTLSTSVQNPSLAVSESQAAYLIYTSGSTGNPKGVVMPHKALINLLQWQSKVLPLKGTRKVLQFTPFSFDVSFQEIFSTFVSGGELVLIADDVRRDPVALLNYLQEHDIERLFLPYVMLNSMATVARLKADLCLPQLLDVVTAGEALIVSHAIRNFFTTVCCADLHNHYGPSETHVVTAYTMEGDPQDWPVMPPIGRPIDNTEIYLLDEHGNEVESDQSGEVCVAGDSLAIGYYQRPDETKNKFVEHITLQGESRLLYKTGDIGQWDTAKQLQCLGRNDHQVKIRGFRVELGEIEEVLLRADCVTSAVVVAQRDHASLPRLVAFVKASDTESLSDAEMNSKLRQHILNFLPDYMVPVAIIPLERLPMTASGKIDRKALADREWQPQTNTHSLPLSTETERDVAKIWSQVLGVQVSCRDQHFIQLGGHSLNATQVTGLLRAKGYQVSVHDLVTRPKLDTFSAWLDSQESPSTVHSPQIFEPQNGLDSSEVSNFIQGLGTQAQDVKAVRPLNALQQGILYQHLLEDSGDTYVLWQLLKFDSKTLLEHYINAMQDAVDRHDALRTSVFHEGLPQPLQVVWHRAKVMPEWVEFDANATDVAQALYDFCEPSNTRFDLTQAPLQRLVCAKDGKNWLLLHVFHHIALDHLSLESIEREIELQLLDASSTLPKPISFTQYASLVEEEDAAKEYFQNKMADYECQQYPFGIAGHLNIKDKVVDLYESLPSALSETLYQQAQTLGISCAAIFHLAWAKVLAGFSCQTDTVFATVLSGRMGAAPGLDSAIGLFINTLPLRVNFSGLTVQQSLQETHTSLIELMQFERSSLAQAQQSLDGTPQLSSLFNYRHSQSDYVLMGDPLATPHKSNVEGLYYSGIVERTNYPIVISVDDRGTSHVVNVQCTSALDERRIYAYFHNALSVISQTLEDNPHIPLATLDILYREERTQLEQWNKTKRAFSDQVCLHQLIEQQAAKTPNSPALLYKNESVSFAQLNQRANQFAHYLHTHMAVGPDVVVGICMSRSVNMVIALLSVLKAGGAYMPLDPSYPASRLNYMVNNSKPQVLLTHQNITKEARVMLSQARANGVSIIDLDREETCWQSQSVGNLSQADTGCSARSLAYVIYTSGSTGNPKGVMNEHLGVVNRLQWMQRTYDVSDNDCILQKTPFSFDVSVWEFFLPLMTGARLLLAEPEGHKDPNYMMSLIREHDVTISHFVPSMLSLFLEHVSAPLPLKKVFSSGEALPVNTLDKFKSALPGVALHNLYGPTEAAIDVSHWDCLLETSLDTVPIGLPVDNTQLYILDASMNACPIGVTGELFIGGVQVARGYHNQPELTKERFLPDIFHPSSGSKLYKTGDLARFRHDGNIEYVGRNDFQVKIRGFRIELEEIENTLRGCPGVKDCVVLAQPIAEDNLRLVAFLIAQGDEPAIDDVGVQDYMREQVSEFMIPSAYQWLDAFPLNPNGKLDRKQLMQLAEDTHIELVEGDSVDGPVEMALEQIWQSLLNCGQLGRSTHFYAVGGQSLLAVKLLNMINQQFGLSLSLSQLINNMTIAEQASLILAQDSAQTIATQANDTSEPSAEVLALPTQKAIYKSVKLAPNNLENNSYLVLAFDSSNPPEHKSLKKALQKVFSQYLSLHARYSLRDDKVILTPAERFNFRLEKRQSLGTLKADLVDFVRPFTLEDGCNVRARLIYGDDIHLLLDFSHASVDGMAISLILQQLSDVELLSGEPLCRLSDYSRLYYSDNMATIRQQHHDYWVSRLIDQKRNKVVRKGTQAITLSVMVNRAETAQLAQIASSCLVSVSEICMTIFLVLKARIEGQHEQLSSVAFHGRDTLMQQGVVAPIMSVLPILVDVPYKLVKRVLNDVCDVMRDAFKHYLYDPQNIAETNADISNTLLFPNSFYGFYEYPSYQADIAGSHCVQIEAPDVIEQSQLWNNTCEVVYRGDELMVSLHFTGIDDCLDAAAVERMYREILKETFDLV